MSDIMDDDETPAAGDYVCVEPEGKKVILPDGRVLPIAMLLDKYGNETEIIFDSVLVLAGSKDLGWFEFDLVMDMWEQMTVH